MEYKDNDHSIKGIKQQFKYPTSDFAKTIIDMKIDEKYIDPMNWPKTSSEWDNIIKECMRNEYEDEMDIFIKGNGYIINMMYHNETDFKSSRIKMTKGIYNDIINDLRDSDNSIGFGKSIRAVINAMRLNWIKGNDQENNVKKCAVCDDQREEKYHIHLLFNCRETEKDRTDHIDKDQWYDVMDDDDRTNMRRKIYDFFFKWNEISDDLYEEYKNKENDKSNN